MSLKSGYLSYTLGLALTLLLLSCEEIMDIEFTDGRIGNLVVKGMITTDIQSHSVRLTYTSDYFSPSEPVNATGANVSITDGDSIFQLKEVSPGMYITNPDVKGEVGSTYTLNITLPDGREFEASSYLKRSVEIDSIGQSANFASLSGNYGYDVLYYGPEPEPAGDSYFYKLYIDDRLCTDTITEIAFVNDDFVNGSYIFGFSVYRIRETDIYAPLNVMLEMYSITPEYYDYLTALRLETVWKGSPWDGPPANLPGNISNKGRGYFLAADVRRAQKVFIPTDRIY